MSTFRNMFFNSSRLDDPIKASLGLHGPKENARNGDKAHEDSGRVHMPQSKWKELIYNPTNINARRTN
uniref:Putative ovule protein n=1 Tax=Solanum chacoense TaxID=4108 RepID=A0A0V0HH08_SOLCH